MALELKGGLVDLQVNGYLGRNFSRIELAHEDVRAISRDLAERGTGAFCPTIVTCPAEVLERSAGVIAEVAAEDLPCRIIGIHLEGPFISPLDGARGAHPLSHVKPPDLKLFDRVLKKAPGMIRMMTVAPEVDGVVELIRHATAAGVKVGIGHSIAGREDVARGVEAGASFVTHLGNGLPRMIDRHDNPVWPLLAEDRLRGMFVVDGHHLPPDFIKVALRAKGLERFVVTSDASSVAGLPPGTYQSIGREVILEPSGRLRCADSPYLAGSSATMMDCMNFLGSLGLLDDKDLARTGRENPLELIGLGLDALGESPVVLVDNGRFTVTRGD